MDQIRIRPAHIEDMEAVHQLVQELAIYEEAGEEVTTTVADYKRDLEAGNFEVLVADLNGTITGMVLYYPAYSTWKGRMLYLEDFVVAASYRRRGIGQELFDAFLKTARERDYRMVKWQVLDWNEPAVSFYEANRATIERNWWNVKIIFSRDKNSG